MRVCIIRHGETDWNAMGIIQGLTNTELNERGLWQAQKCAEYLSNEKWDAIISSPLKRAYQTAKMIANHLGLDIQVMDEFVEKDYGESTGAALHKQFLQMDQQTAFTEKRVLSGLERLQLTEKNAKILLITHGDVIHLILSALFSDEKFKSPVKNASLTELEHLDDTWKVNCFNMTNHLITIKNTKWR